MPIRLGRHAQNKKSASLVPGSWDHFKSILRSQPILLEILNNLLLNGLIIKQ